MPKKMGGIPLLWVIYQEDKPKPNVIFKLHPMFKGDWFLNETFEMVADYMRNNYLKKED